MSLTGDRFQKTAGVAQLVRDGRERLNAIPGVEASAFASACRSEDSFGLHFNIVGSPVDETQMTGRWLDERLTRLLRCFQDSYPARPRLY